MEFRFKQSAPNQGILSDGVSRNLAGLAIFEFLMTFTLMFVVCAVALDVKGSARQVPLRQY